MELNQDVTMKSSVGNKKYCSWEVTNKGQFSLVSTD